MTRTGTGIPEGSEEGSLPGRSMLMLLLKRRFIVPDFREYRETAYIIRNE